MNTVDCAILARDSYVRPDLDDEAFEWPVGAEIVDQTADGDFAAAAYAVDSKIVISIKGPNRDGLIEVEYLGDGGCPAPVPGRQYLLGGWGPWWVGLREPRLMLAGPPTKEQLAAWRAAASHPRPQG